MGGKQQVMRKKFGKFLSIGGLVPIFISEMQPLDKNTLFAIFEQGDEEIYKEHKVTGVLNNPYVLMGMVIRGMENWHLMDIMYKRSYPEDYKEVRSAIMLKYMTKLVGYLERIDSTKFESVYTIGESYDSKTVRLVLNGLLGYFERIEYYEKCAVIKEYIDLLAGEIIQKELLR